MSARRLDRWRLTLPLVLPALGGLAYLAAFAAPARLIAVNAGALAFGLIWIVWGRLPANPKARLGLAGVCLAALFLPLLLGPEVGGVSRWLRVGPVLLHSGALFLPLALVLAGQAVRLGPAILALAAAALTLQPDAAMLAGLAAGSAALAAMHRSAGFALVALAGAALAMITFGRGTLPPQVFTEDVLAQVWQAAPPAALVLGALLFLAAPWLLARSGAVALAAMLVAVGAMALIAPFPTPLIGYGASPIFGLALALGALGTSRQM